MSSLFTHLLLILAMHYVHAAIFFVMVNSVINCSEDSDIMSFIICYCQLCICQFGCFSKPIGLVD